MDQNSQNPLRSVRLPPRGAGLPTGSSSAGSGPVPPAGSPLLPSHWLPHCFACALFSSGYRPHLASPRSTLPGFSPGAWSVFQSTSPRGRLVVPRLIKGRPCVGHCSKHFTCVLSSCAHRSPTRLELPVLGSENEFRGAKERVGRENHSPCNWATERHSRSLGLSDSEALLGITELSSPLWLFKPCVLCLLFLSSNSSVFSKEVSRGPVPGAPLCSCRLLHTRLHTCFFSPRRLCFSESLHHQPGPWQTGVSPINN